VDPTGVGMHIRTRDRVGVLDAIRTAMDAEGLSWVGAGPGDTPTDSVRMLLLPPRGAWTSLYPEDTSLARELAGLIALQLKAPVFTVGRYDDAAFFYVYHDRGGNLADEYDSCPDWSKDVDEDDASASELERTRGRPEVLSTLLASGQEPAALSELLKASRIERLRDHSAYRGPATSREPLTQLADLLALPDLLEDFDELWHLGLDDDEDVDLRYLAYGEPEERLDLGELLSRFRAKLGTLRSSPPEGDDPEPSDDATKPDESPPPTGDSDPKAPGTKPPGTKPPGKKTLGRGDVRHMDKSTQTGGDD
jgi:hypothetical protein